LTDEELDTLVKEMYEQFFNTMETLRQNEWLEELIYGPFYGISLKRPGNEPRSL
jgi:hypothetical protein